MIGTSSTPQCGFSSRVAGVLNYLEVKYKDVNVLANDNLREGVKTDADGLISNKCCLLYTSPSPLSLIHISEPTRPY